MPQRERGGSDDLATGDIRVAGVGGTGLNGDIDNKPNWAPRVGATYQIVAPGKRVCPYHLHHAQEEMFVILEGSGTLRVAGELVPIRSGDVIFIPAGPEYPHQILNTSDAPLKYLAIGTNEAPEICEYPDSGKFLAEGSLDTDNPFEVIHRNGGNLDYWDGEP